MFEYYIKSGDFRITDKTLEKALKYLARKYSINYKNVVFEPHYNSVITFKDCYNEETSQYYFKLPAFTYTGLRFMKKNIQVNRIVDNACILATINGENIFDVFKMRYYILWIARKYAHKTDKGLIISDITINDLLSMCCENLQDKIDNGVIDKCTIEQSRKNCRNKVITVGNISSNEKNSLSHERKFTDEELHYIKCWRNIEGLSLRKTKTMFEEEFGKTISIKSIQNYSEN